MATKKEAAAKKTTPKATPKKAAEPVVSQEELLALGEEMNTLLFPGEEVDFSEMSDEEIIAQIKADAENIDGKDQFSDDSKATLAAIGIDIEWAAPAAAKKDVAAGKKAAATKKEAPAKKEKAVKEPAVKKGRSASPDSNKARVFAAWKNGKGVVEIPALAAVVDGAVKENTIKAWLGSWKNGKNLPACATK